jgi:hypothetical protein
MISQLLFNYTIILHNTELALSLQKLPWLFNNVKKLKITLCEKVVAAIIVKMYIIFFLLFADLMPSSSLATWCFHAVRIQASVRTKISHLKCGINLRVNDIIISRF